MSNIRRQSIISSTIVYFGFALGFVNTFLFTRENTFTPEQYGLVGAFIAIGNVMFSFSILGMHSFVYKFYPYYNDNLPPKENDMITWALLTTLVGFAFVTIAGFFLKDFVIRKYVTNAPEIIKYYYWLFPFGLGLTIFTLLEAFAWQLRHSVVTNFLREVFFRLLTTILIVLFFTRIISGYSSFIRIYSLTYLFIALVLLVFLISRKEIHFTLKPSRVTKKFFKKIVTLASFVWSGGLVFNISTVFDTLVIAAVMPNGLRYAAIYSLAQNIASLIQAPQRGIVSASIAPLSKAWKDKDFEKINRIYHRSSINQLIFSIGMFSLIWLNFADGVSTFSLKETYFQALPVFLFIGLMRILDMGTGVNAQIIGTSTYWRFEFFTGIILLAMALPMNYILTKRIGVTGPAISNLIAFTIYNLIRFNFLYRKFGMQPFTSKSAIAILLGAASCAACYFLFRHYTGFLWIVVRSIVFALLYGGGVLLLQLSPDLLPVLGSIGKKVRLKR
jgi:O-antigen/teichoic acid export membrane protein